MRKLLIATVALVGCGVDDPSVVYRAAHNNLGIQEITVLDTGDKAIVTGSDDSNKTIATLILERGHFDWVEDGVVGDPYDGRRMAIEVKDEHTAWQTVGEEPVMHLPQMPQRGLAGFVAEPHVRATLGQWNLAFVDQPVAASEPDVVGNESPYYIMDNVYGTGVISTCGQGQGSVSCPFLSYMGDDNGYRYSGVPSSGSCPGGVQGQVMWRNSGWYSGEQNESVLYWACNSSSGGGWLGKKTCSYYAEPGYGGNTTSCGQSSNQCQPCPGFGDGSWNYYYYHAYVADYGSTMSAWM